MGVQIGRAMPRRSVNLEGAILVPHSLAHVNRELVVALRGLGVDIGLCPTEPDRPELFQEPRLAGLERCLAYSDPEVVLRHRWPPDFAPAGDAFQVQLLHWEFGSLPRDWVEPLQRHTHEIWVLSSWVRDAFVRAGIAAERVAVIGGGVAPDVFRPEAPPIELPTEKRFRFLCVGGPLRRKGLDVLLQAYRAEFRRDEDVTLVIKDIRAYGNGGRADLQAAVQDTAGPEVVLMDRDLGSTEIAGLYTACQALVHPYRGEGLGLPILEAMAAGLPVAATAHGACLDYLTEENGYLIDAEEVQFPEERVEKVETVGRPFWAEPRVDSVRRTMRRMFEDREGASERAVRGRATVLSGHTWECAAHVIRDRLDRLFDERDRRLRALAHFMEGSAALEEGRPLDACRSLEGALALEPCFPCALSEYGVALAQTGRLGGARRVLEQAIEIDPELDDAKRNLEVVEQALVGEGESR